MLPFCYVQLIPINFYNRHLPFCIFHNKKMSCTYVCVSFVFNIFCNNHMNNVIHHFNKISNVLKENYNNCLSSSRKKTTKCASNITKENINFNLLLIETNRCQLIKVQQIINKKMLTNSYSSTTYLKISCYFLLQPSIV